MSRSRVVEEVVTKMWSVCFRSNCQLRNTLHKALTICDKWKTPNMRVSNAESMDSSGSSGRLARFFSMRRGSTQQYDVDMSDTVSLTSPMKSPHMPQLNEVITRRSFFISDFTFANSLSPSDSKLFILFYFNLFYHK